MSYICILIYFCVFFFFIMCLFKGIHMCLCVCLFFVWGGGNGSKANTSSGSCWDSLKEWHSTHVEATRLFCGRSVYLLIP